MRTTNDQICCLRHISFVRVSVVVRGGGSGRIVGVTVGVTVAVLVRCRLSSLMPAGSIVDVGVRMSMRMILRLSFP